MKLSAPASPTDLLPGLVPATGPDASVGAAPPSGDFASVMLGLEPGSRAATSGPAATGGAAVAAVANNGLPAWAGPSGGPRLEPRDAGRPARPTGPASSVSIVPPSTAPIGAPTTESESAVSPGAECAARDEGLPGDVRKEAPARDVSTPVVLFPVELIAGGARPEGFGAPCPLLREGELILEGTIAGVAGETDPDEAASAQTRESGPCHVGGGRVANNSQPGELARWVARPDWPGNPVPSSPRLEAAEAAEIETADADAAGKTAGESMPAFAGLSGDVTAPWPARAGVAAIAAGLPAPVPPPVSRSGAAKLAEPVRGSDAAEVSPFAGDHKKSDRPLGQRVGSPAATDGTGVAQLGGKMPFSAPELAPTPALESTIPIRGIAGAADAELPVVGEMPADADLGTDAARAVEAVFTAAELARQGERSSVTLRFALGEADLSVRVAVRDQQVHATFVTDSADLRAVLAQECSAVSAEPGRAYRFSADITGGGGDSAGLMSSGDDSAAGRREDRRDTAGAAFAGWRTRPLATGPAGAAPHPGVRANSVHLHTLA